MKTKVQSEALKREQLTSSHASQIFGLVMTAVFVAMLILNAIFY
jgi:hypothetical protein